MAQRDYVRRGQPAPSRRKRTPHGTHGRSKNAYACRLAGNGRDAAKAVTCDAIGGLYFVLTIRKKGRNAAKPESHRSEFPPKPEERWRYIKSWKVASRACVHNQRNRPPAAESWNPGSSPANASTHGANAGRICVSSQRNNSAVERANARTTPANATAPARQAQQRRQWAQTQPVRNRTQPRVNERPPQTRTGTVRWRNPRIKSAAKADGLAATLIGILLQTPAHTSAAAPKTAPITRA